MSGSETTAEAMQPADGALTPIQQHIARIRALLAEMPDISQVPPSSQAYERGLTAYNQGNYAEAETAFREAAQARPDMGGYHYALACALTGQQKHAEAETAFRAALRTESNVAAYHYGLGCALQSQQRYPDAETAFREAQRIDPTMSPNRSAATPAGE